MPSKHFFDLVSLQVKKQYQNWLRNRHNNEFLWFYTNKKSSYFFLIPSLKIIILQNCIHTYKRLAPVLSKWWVLYKSKFLWLIFSRQQLIDKNINVKKMSSDLKSGMLWKKVKSINQRCLWGLFQPSMAKRGHPKHISQNTWFSLGIIRKDLHGFLEEYFFVKFRGLCEGRGLV